MKLTGADRYTITLPKEGGTVTFVQGETLDATHAKLVPEADFDLFTREADTAAAAPAKGKAAAAAATTATQN